MFHVLLEKGALEETGRGIVAGDRPDNKWLQYNSSSLPRTQKDWDLCAFVEKTHWGYYSWPRCLFETFPSFWFLGCSWLCCIFADVLFGY